MSDSYRTLFLFVKNYTNGTVLFVYGVHPLRHAEPHALLECQAEGAVAAVAAEHRRLLVVYGARFLQRVGLRLQPRQLVQLL